MNPVTLSAGNNITGKCTLLPFQIANVRFANSVVVELARLTMQTKVCHYSFSMLEKNETRTI